MKVGDMVKFKLDFPLTPREYDINIPYPLIQGHGIILQLSRTGHETKSAKIMFNDGEVVWAGTNTLEVVSEGG